MTPHFASSGAAWTIIIPVKATAAAKTRLRPFSAPDRAALALAFALDTAVAALGCTEVRRVVAVTSDAAASRALRILGVEVVADQPSAGLNAALAHGESVIRGREPRASVAAMCADLPALRSHSLSAALAVIAAPSYGFVADASGEGTTLLGAGPGIELRPRFGRGSAGRHRDQGAVCVMADGLARLRRDVDTPSDLADARRLGVGSYTRAALGEIEAA